MPQVDRFKLTTGHGVHVQGLDQANEDFYGGTLPLREKRKKRKRIKKMECAGRSEGQKELELNEMSGVASTLKQLLVWSM